MLKSFKWLGDQVKRRVSDAIESRLIVAGERVVARASQLAPKKTGALARSISYVVMTDESTGRHTLSIQVKMPYGVFQEFGTRHIRPHPFIRPALNEIGRIFGGVSMDFNRATSATWQGIYHTRGRYVVPKTLTPKQLSHVQRHLVPSGKALHRGNVKRARLHVRKFG